jgi:hypothetical protein
MKTLTRFLSSGACLTLAALSLFAIPSYAQYSSPVKVVNSGPAQAVPIVNSAQPFTATCPNFTTCNFPIPNGKRLVIESIAGFAELANGAAPIVVLVHATFGSGEQLGASGWTLIVPTSTQSSNGIFTFIGFNQKTYLQAEATNGNGSFGGMITITNSGGDANSQCSTTVSGYLI